MINKWKILFVLFSLFCGGCGQGDDIKKTYSPIDYGNGLKFGNSFIDIDGSIQHAEFSHGIDTIWLKLKLNYCEGISIQATYNGYSFLDNVVDKLGLEVSPGVYKSKLRGRFYVITQLNLSKDEESRKVGQTLLTFSASDYECAYNWLVKNISGVDKPVVGLMSEEFPRN